MPYTTSLFKGPDHVQYMNRQHLYDTVRGRLNTVWRECLDKHGYNRAIKKHDKDSLNASYDAFKQHTKDFVNVLTYVQHWFKENPNFR